MKTNYKTSYLLRLVSWVDGFLVFLSFGMYFRYNSEARKKLYKKFSLIEDDTVWQIYNQLENLENPEFLAAFFKQYIEEMYHAEVFGELSDDSRRVNFERRPLFKNNEEWKLFHYCMVGEAEAALRFENILKYVKNSKERELIYEVLCDEQGHIDLAHDFLRKIGISDADIVNQTKTIFIQRRRESFLRVIKNIFSLLGDFLLYISYFLFCWLPFLQVRRRMGKNIFYEIGKIESL